VGCTVVSHQFVTAVEQATCPLCSACGCGCCIQAEVTALEQQLFSIAGRPFNLNSPKECSAVIFEELGLKGKAIKRTKSGYFSTSM
jgi:hypothetical protein